MIQWIIQYWVQVLFGVIAAGLGLLAKKFWNMYQNEKKSETNAGFAQTMEKCSIKIRESVENIEKELKERELILLGKIQEVHNNSYEHDLEIKKDVEEITKDVKDIKNGVLVIEGAYFMQECQRLLEQEDIIKVEEFWKVTADHNAYNALGGNHTGDQIYDAVKKKFEAQHNK